MQVGHRLSKSSIAVCAHSLLGHGTRRAHFPAAVFWQSGQTKSMAGGHRQRDLSLSRGIQAAPDRSGRRGAISPPLPSISFRSCWSSALRHASPPLALLVMTLVIQIFVYPGAWPTHGTWIACFLVLIAQGPGAVSLDHLIGKWWRTRRTSQPVTK